MLLYPDGIHGPPSRRKGKKGSKKGPPGTKGIPGKTPGPWRSGYVLPGKAGKATKALKKLAAGRVLVGAGSKALVPSSSAGAAPSTPRSMWPWMLGGLGALLLAFWYTKGKGRRPLGFA